MYYGVVMKICLWNCGACSAWCQTNFLLHKILLNAINTFSSRKPALTRGGKAGPGRFYQRYSILSSLFSSIEAKVTDGT